MLFGCRGSLTGAGIDGIMELLPKATLSVWQVRRASPHNSTEDGRERGIPMHKRFSLSLSLCASQGASHAFFVVAPEKANAEILRFLLGG